MQLLIEQGVATFVEAGPGKVLSGLMRQTSRDVKTLNVEDAASLEATQAALVAKIE
jgi:[acyl-carrier-protein] S-malonyltransferase